MKQGLAFVLLGLMALVAQSVTALWIPARFVPDLGLVLVMAIALRVRSVATGLTLAAMLGYCTDLLSGSLLGQHTLLRLGAYAATRYGSARLSLRGVLPQILFAAFLSAGYAVSLWGLVAFVNPHAASAPVHPGDLLPHALVTGLAAPIASWALGKLLVWLGVDESAQRLLPYEPRSFSA